MDNIGDLLAKHMSNMAVYLVKVVFSLSHKSRSKFEERIIVSIKVQRSESCNHFETRDPIYPQYYKLGERILIDKGETLLIICDLLCDRNYERTR